MGYSQPPKIRVDITEEKKNVITVKSDQGHRKGVIWDKIGSKNVQNVGRHQFFLHYRVHNVILITFEKKGKESVYFYRKQNIDFQMLKNLKQIGFFGNV